MRLPRRKVLLSLDPAVVEALDAEARRRGVDRSALVTRMVERSGLTARPAEATLPLDAVEPPARPSREVTPNFKRAR